MALVADYGSSDEDEMQEEDEAPQTIVASTSSSGVPVPPAPAVPGPSSSSSSSYVNNRPLIKDHFFEDSDEEEEEEGGGTLAQFLPKPKEPVAMEEDDEVEEMGPIPPKKTYGDEEKPPPPPTSFQSTGFHPDVVSKKVKGVVKIAAPSLKDFEDDDDVPGISRRFADPTKKGSGLFAILPAPKTERAEIPINFLKSSTATKAPSSTKTQNMNSSNPLPSSSSSAPAPFIPDSVRNANKRPAVKSKMEEIRSKYMKKEMNVKIVSRKDKETKVRDDSDEEGDGPTNFFSFGSGADEVDEETLEKLKLPMPQEKEEDDQAEAWNGADAEMEEEDISHTSPFVQSLPEAEIRKFMQPKKGGKIPDHLDIIDVRQDDLKPDETTWIKTLTDKSALPPRRAKGLGGIQRKKHQITYLAVEAQLRQEELEQQWAAGRQNKRESRMKYGF